MLKGILKIFIITFCFCTTLSHAQKTSKDPKSLFEQGGYSDAFNASENLLKTYPDDPVYNYYAGASLFHLGKYTECLTYLAKAESRLTPKDLWLYKGKTLLYLFRLEESRRAFELYSQNTALRNIIAVGNTDWMEAIDNIKKASQTINVVEIIKRDTISKDVIIDYVNSETTRTGTWVQKDARFFTNLGIQKGEGFYYNFFSQSDYQCFVITGKKSLTRNDLDIFYSCLNGDIFEQTLQALPPQINSRSDQRYPVFDENTQTLYFSSKGNNSFGGYDIFLSTYDKNKNRWGDPQNAGFPINSPFDDYLVGTGKNNCWFIATNRYQEQNKVEVLLIKKKEGTISGNIDEPDLLLAECKFLKEAQPNKIDKDLASAIQKLKKDKEGKADEVQQEKLVEQETFFNEEEYKKQLDNALTLQLKADSVGRLAEEKRYYLADIKDHKKRVAEIDAIAKYEKVAAEIQKEADVAFAKVRKMELKAEANSKSPTDASQKKPGIHEQITLPASTDDFKIYNSSQYSKENPFNFNYELPKGLLYRIQMGVFSKDISYDYFGGLSPITAEIIKEKGLKKYYVGLFTTFSEADKALQKVHQEGFVDSFIIAWFNGKKVSINRAEDIEKELNKE